MFDDIDKTKQGEVSNKEVVTYLKLMSDGIQNEQVNCSQIS